MRKLIHKNDIVKIIGKDNFLTRGLASVAMSVLGFNEINRMYSPSADLKDQTFTEHMLNVYGITYDAISDSNVIPKEGPFVIVSNHPFGAIEGIILYDAISKIRPDFKVMANFILSYIPNLKNVFIPVNPFTENPEWKSSVGGIKAAMEHLAKGNCLGIFPAGEVSRCYDNSQQPKDTDWSVTIAKLVRKSGVPVIPLYFDGRNSNKFYKLARMHSLLGTAMLPHELLNKRNSHITMKIGKPIVPSELECYDDYKKMAAYLRTRSYALEANINKGETKVPTNKMEPLSSPLEPNVLLEELNEIREKSFLFDCAQYECFLADYDDIPNLIYELGIRREEAFRAIGEGSGKKLDTDKYDTYYKHLILWDKEGNRLVGGYRLGMGKDIVEKKGISGFYISSLFEIEEPFKDVLSKSIELGRSFVTLDYQKDALPLMLLIKGLMMVAYKHKNVDYFIGPVSISNWYPKFYKSLMAEYISNEFSCDSFKNMAHARTPFIADFLRTDPEILLENNMSSVERFDRYLMKLSGGDYRLPTLFKKYLKMNSKFLCFNIDPDFNDTLDGLLLLKFSDIPESELLMLMKDSSEEEKKMMVKRFLDK